MVDRLATELLDELLRREALREALEACDRRAQQLRVALDALRQAAAQRPRAAPPGESEPGARE